MTTKEMVEVIQAFEQGQPIESRTIDKWEPCHVPSWNFALCDYRVKPEPREWWIARFSDGSGVAYTTLDQAQRNATDRNVFPIIHVREVTD